MSQVDNVFTAFWMDTTTTPGTPLTGLSATIKIKESPGGTIVINNLAMTNVGDGWYEYVFSAMDATKNYTYTCSPGATAYIDSGVTDKRMNNIDKAITDIAVSGGGGGGYINIQGIQGSIANNGKYVISELEKKIDEAKEDIERKIESEKLDITPIIDKIDSIDIPEPKEVDLSPISASLGTIKTQNTKLSQKLGEIKDNQDNQIQESNKEYEETLKEAKQLDEEDNLEKEEIIKEIEVMDKEELDEILKEMDALDAETNQTENGN